MKIAHIVWGMKTGGVETMLVNIINEHVKSAEVNLYIINDFVEESLVSKLSPLCKVFRLNRKPKDRCPLKILKLNWWIWLFKPDIIHVHSYRVSKLIIGRWNIVRTVHNTNNIPDEYPKMRALFAISDIVKEEVVRQGFPQVKTIYNGIVTKDIVCHPRIIPEDKKYKIVQVSRLDIKQKGQDILIKGLYILVHRYQTTNFELHLVGEGNSEPMLRQMVSDCGLNDYVFFDGLKSQDFLFHHLCDYDLFVQPSRFEGFGITVAEALAAQVPVLVSDIEGPMEIIGHGEYGMSFRSGDSEDLAEKLKLILEGNYDYDKVVPAREHIVQQYDVSLTAQRYLEEYTRLVPNC